MEINEGLKRRANIRKDSIILSASLTLYSGSFNLDLHIVNLKARRLSSEKFLIIFSEIL